MINKKVIAYGLVILFLWSVVGFLIITGFKVVFQKDDQFNIGAAYFSSAIAQTQIEGSDQWYESEGEQISRGSSESRQSENKKETFLSGLVSAALPGNEDESLILAEHDYEEMPESDFTEVVPKVAPEEIVASPPVTGAVLIYHTHATESYSPYSDGNYHSENEEGTVRQVASILEQQLTEKGITVYHDKSLHDRPTYQSSYARSLETAKKYLSEHKEIVLVIDLHRDASAAGQKYATTAVNGEVASSFNVVVGNQNANYAHLTQFATTFLNKSNELYPGLGGRIIEREYKFNGYLSNQFLLLEVGNNENTIDEVKVTGAALADVIERIMKGT